MAAGSRAAAHLRRTSVSLLSNDQVGQNLAPKNINKFPLGAVLCGKGAADDRT